MERKDAMQIGGPAVQSTMRHLILLEVRARGVLDLCDVAQKFDVSFIGYLSLPGKSLNDHRSPSLALPKRRLTDITYQFSKR